MIDDGFSYWNKAKSFFRRPKSKIAMTIVILGCVQEIIPIFRILASAYGSLNNALQALWNIFSGPFRGDEFNMEVYGSCIYWLCFYWAFGSIFTFVDLTGKPAFMMNYKIQESRQANKVHRGAIFNVAKTVLINQTVVALPFLYLFYNLRKLRGFNRSDQVPILHYAVIEILGYALIEEIIFYYMHRLLHKGILYRMIHKTHHEWTQPIGITSMYCHPIEHVLANIIPTITGALIFGSHISTQIVWFFISAPFGILIHSGYHIIPFLASPRAHDYHHVNYRYNFAFLGIMDKIHGTTFTPKSSQNREEKN